MSTPKHKGTTVKLFVPTTDYEAWQGLAKQSGVSVPVAIYSLARTCFEEMLQKEKEKLRKEKEAKDVVDVHTDSHIIADRDAGSLVDPSGNKVSSTTV